MCIEENADAFYKEKQNKTNNNIPPYLRIIQCIRWVSQEKTHTDMSQKPRKVSSSMHKVTGARSECIFMEYHQTSAVLKASKGRVGFRLRLGTNLPVPFFLLLLQLGTRCFVQLLSL